MSDRSQICSILYCDVVKSSAIPDGSAKREMSALLKSLRNEAIERYGALYTNDTGDGALIVCVSAAETAELALRIRDAFRTKDWMRLGLGAPVEIRVGIDLGLVGLIFEDGAAVQAMGNALDAASRIEPVTPPNRVYCTRHFYRQFRNEEAANIQGRSIGWVSLAKGSGTAEIFDLTWTHESVSPVSAQPKTADGEEPKKSRFRRADAPRAADTPARRADDPRVSIDHGHHADDLGFPPEPRRRSDDRKRTDQHTAAARRSPPEPAVTVPPAGSEATEATTARIEAEPAVITNDSEDAPVARRVTDVDVDRFLLDAFLAIKGLFRLRLDELKDSDPRHVSTNLSESTPADFTCIVYVDGRAAAHCRIWRDAPGSGNGIFYASRLNGGAGASFDEHLVVSEEGRDAFLNSTAGDPETGAGIDRMDRHSAAQLLWRRFNRDFLAVHR